MANFPRYRGLNYLKLHLGRELVQAFFDTYFANDGEEIQTAVGNRLFGIYEAGYKQALIDKNLAKDE
jgi:hypothetical protein